LRCVLDTNVLVSALLVPGSKPRQALDRAFREGRVLLSFATLAELYDVLHRKQFRRYIDEEDARSFIAALARESEWIEADVQIRACRDPKDNKFLEVAVSGKAAHLITGDSDLLILDPFQAIRILSPQEFLDLASPPVTSRE
jgi:putative PIN family toxin of toxin-antitoxin system